MRGVKIIRDDVWASVLKGISMRDTMHCGNVVLHIGYIDWACVHIYSDDVAWLACWLVDEGHATWIETN